MYNISREGFKKDIYKFWSRACHEDPVRMKAWRRLCAAWVSSGVPDMTISRLLVRGSGSCTVTIAPEI